MTRLLELLFPSGWRKRWEKEWLGWVMQPGLLPLPPRVVMAGEMCRALGVLRTPMPAVPELWGSKYYHLKRRVGFHPKGRHSDHLSQGKGFLDGSDGNAGSACNSGDPDSIPGSGRSPGEGNGYPLQYSCLENSVDGRAWQACKELDSTEWLTLIPGEEEAGFEPGWKDSSLFFWELSWAWTIKCGEPHGT